jgi:polypeptide N-acetylgalactosaminyltransferase
VILYPCHGTKGNQWWQYDPSLHKLVHVVSKLCLTMAENK